MKNIIPLAFATTASLLIASPTQAQSLSQSEITNTLIASELQFKNRRGIKGTIQFHSNGKLNWRNERGLKGAGEWRLEGDKLCSKIFKTAAIRGRDWKCDAVKKRADGKYRLGSNTVWK